ncbi:hypothetical protein GGI18_006388, partial [Coemansia linderi]
MEQQINELRNEITFLRARLPLVEEVTEPTLTDEFIAECATFSRPDNTLRRLGAREPPPEESPLAPVAIPPQLVAVADARHVSFKNEQDIVNGLNQAAWQVMRALAAFRQARQHGQEGHSNFVDKTLANLLGALTYEADQQTKNMVNKLCKELKLPTYVSSVALDAVGSRNSAEFDGRLARHLENQQNDQNLRRTLQHMGNNILQQQQRLG